MNYTRFAIAAFVVCASTLPLHAGLIANGGFEGGFTSWTTAQQVGSEGGFFLQTGTTTPILGLTVPPAPEGATAAMTEAEGPGSHILYEDFVVPTGFANAVLSFSLFVHNGASEFVTPETLDFATPELNQQVRVDLLGNTADPFSVDPSDVLMNVYRTEVGDPLESGYTSFAVNITSLLQAHAGDTLRLRFAEVDNVFFLNAGVDAVDIVTSPIPEPST